VELDKQNTSLQLALAKGSEQCIKDTNKHETHTAFLCALYSSTNAFKSSGAPAPESSSPWNRQRQHYLLRDQKD
jgi:hypothetical protein